MKIEDENIVKENNIPLVVKWGTMRVVMGWVMGFIFMSAPVLFLISYVIKKGGFVLTSELWEIAGPLLCAFIGFFIFFSAPYELRVVKDGIVLNYLLFKIFISNERINRIELKEASLITCGDALVKIRIVFSKNFLFIIDSITLGLCWSEGYDEGEIYTLEAMVSYYLKLKMEREWEDKL